MKESVNNLRQKFKLGKIEKQEYINKMFDLHQTLIDYCDLISSTEIEKILITQKGLLFTTKQRNINFFCDIIDKRSAPFEILNFEEYESDDAHMIYSLIKEGDTVLDIGANIGWYTINIRKNFNNVIVHAFEPIPSTFENLDRNVNLNNLDQVYLNNFGLSDKVDKIRFFTSENTSVSSSAVNITNDENSKIVECHVKTIDQYVADNNLKIDFIKCDVEGAEIFCFEGGLNSIKKYKPIIFTEMLRKWSAKFNYHPNDIINMLSTIGYHCYKIINQSALLEIKYIDENVIETNFVFLHFNNHSEVIKSYVR